MRGRAADRERPAGGGEGASAGLARSACGKPKAPYFLLVLLDMAVRRAALPVPPPCTCLPGPPHTPFKAQCTPAPCTTTTLGQARRAA